jgi:hypothetical protein
MYAEFGIQRLGRYVQQTGQITYALVTARRTLVDVSRARGNGFGVGTAALESALPALGLRQ